MKHMRHWLSSKRRLMAKQHDLQRQLQEARDDTATAIDCYDALRGYYAELRDEYYNLLNSLTAQLHRVARERDKERELRLAAEDRRDVYLEQLANEEE